MTQYKIASPSGRVEVVYATSFYHAISVARATDGYRWTVKDYLNLN